MKIEKIREVLHAQPFGPFAIRLNNGAQYSFASPRQVGAPEDYR